MKTPLSNIKNIIFDLGGVILDINYHKTVEAFVKLGVNDFEAAYSQAKQTPIFDQFEKGLISEQTFFDHLKKQFNVDFSHAEMVHAWNAMLIRLPQHRISVLENLKDCYSSFLLSNTNETHIDAFQKLISRENNITGFEPFFEKVYYSCRIGKRKPDAEIFLQVLDENNLDPKDTLFIDDSIQHIDGAGKLAIKTFHLTDGNTIENLFKTQ